MNLGKSPARYNQSLDTGISFKDIAGIDEAKDEFEEIVSFLKEPERYTFSWSKNSERCIISWASRNRKNIIS